MKRNSIEEDQVIECAGTEVSFAIASQVRMGGRIVFVLARKSSYGIDMKAIMWNELTLCGRGNPTATNR